jgi:hypothetical protein
VSFDTLPPYHSPRLILSIASSKGYGSYCTM